MKVGTNTKFPRNELRTDSRPDSVLIQVVNARTQPTAVSGNTIGMQFVSPLAMKEHLH